MSKILEKIELYLLYAVVFLFPISFLPAFANAFEPVKLAILVYGLGAVLLVKALRLITTGKLELSSSSFDLPVLLIALAFLASAILRTPNKMDAFFLPGTATAVLGGTLLYYLVNQLSQKEKEMGRMLLFGSATIFSLIVLFATTGLLSKIPQLPLYMQQVAFNPSGGLLPAAIFLAVALPLGIGLFISEKVSGKKALLGAGLAVVSLGLVLAIYHMTPGKPFSPRFPSASVSWAVAIDSLKVSPVFGVGPGNYLTAFSRFRPIEYNATDLWAVKFATAHDFFMTTFTETGLLGAAGLILLLIAFVRLAKAKMREVKLANILLGENAALLSLLLLLLLLALFPVTALLIAVLFMLLAFAAQTKKSSINLSGSSSELAGLQATQKLTSRLPAFLVTLPILLALAYVFIRGGSVLAADARYKKALDAIAANDTSAYDLLREAINLNPYVDRYHINYAQVNLALANSIAQTPADKITDQDRTNISQLIQQAIREGKSSVALNPLRAANWEVLGRIYQALIPFAEGADAFATQSMAQAVALDPINPNLRVALGGVYYGQQDYETAIRVFELATVAKSDFPNAHYNLAFALREKGDIERAISEMTLVLSMVDRNTADYETARAALEDLENRRATATPPAGGELTPPQTAEPVLEPPLELPEESEPPAAPITPTPTPEVGEEEQGTFSLTPTPTVAP